jgi:hypothetical protein
MPSLGDITLESNKYMKINSIGGDLSSDAGLLLFKEFLFKIGAVKLINRVFKTMIPQGCTSIRMIQT